MAARLRLQFGAAAFGFDGGDGVGVGGVLDQLEGDGVAGFGVLGQVDVGHSAASEFAEDFVFADFAAGGGDHYWRLRQCGAG